jgi:integrase
VSIPASILPAVRQHMKDYVPEDSTALVFTGPTGRPIWRGNFNTLTKWREKVEALGMPGLHFHDLRHTGNTLAARTGASTKELMARMGQDSPQAAMIYQHATSEADRAIAKAIDQAVKKARGTSKKAAPRKSRTTTNPTTDEPDDGTAGVLARQG